MKQILTSGLCALVCATAYACPQPKACPVAKDANCYDAYREPYRIAYPRLVPVAEAVEITNTHRAMAMRRAAVLRLREGIRFEKELLAAAPPITEPASSGTVLFGSTEGAGIFETGNEPVPAAPPYPGPGAMRPTTATVHRFAKTKARVPLAAPVPGKPGFVYSPFVNNGSLVDVQGLAPGSLAKDPYSGRYFCVP